MGISSVAGSQRFPLLLQTAMSDGLTVLLRDGAGRIVRTSKGAGSPPVRVTRHLVDEEVIEELVKIFAELQGHHTERPAVPERQLGRRFERIVKDALSREW